MVNLAKNQSITEFYPNSKKIVQNETIENHVETTNKYFTVLGMSHGLALLAAYDEDSSESDHEENNAASDGDSIEELSDDGMEGSDDRMNDKSKEDMDRVIAELTSALIQSKGLLR